jgi:16S rRNA (uracil1498-N3)-methyltransferase
VTNPVFFTDPGALAEVASGEEFVLTGAEARHAVAVKRLSPGESVDVVDGRGMRLSGTVVSTGTESLTVSVETIAPEPAVPFRLTLVQALAKGDRDELAIEAATELGVDEVVPWQAERSIVRWRDAKAAKGKAKWESTVRSAAKQARRATVPDVAPLVDLKSLCGRIGESRLALILHEDARLSLAEAVQRSGLKSEADLGQSILMIVGPEGGMSPREVEQMRDAGAVPVILAPHVLRSSTAGPAAVALLSERLGRWN